MAGLYIHIPFCRSKCAYCDFYSVPLNSVKVIGPPIPERYCHALIEEFKIRHKEIQEPISTVYIGGGTPTALPTEILLGLIRRIKELVGIHNLEVSAPCTTESIIEEFTIEANPEDVSPEFISELCDSGINRISIGIQSFDGNQLAEIRRRHSPDASLSALSHLSASGINYSADLIYGLPGQSYESWMNQLNVLLDFNPPHFSAYLLSYEPGTVLYNRLRKGEVVEAGECEATQMYKKLVAECKSRGYHHYEISNFAFPGKEARHNSGYWNLTPYLGLGCSSHSYDGYNRRYNPAKIKTYIENLEAGNLVTILDNENDINRVNDYIITSLRTSAGLSEKLVAGRWGTSILRELQKNLFPFLTSGKLIKTGSTFRIPEQYWLTADAILRDIILDD